MAVDNYAKYFASSLYPAKCTACGQLIAVNSYFSGSLVATIEALVILPLIITGAVPSVFGGILLLLVFSGGSLFVGKYSGFKAISNSDVLVARVPIGLLAIFVCFGTLFNE